MLLSSAYVEINAVSFGYQNRIAGLVKDASRDVKKGTGILYLRRQ
jgi:hypothetical protein